VRAVFAGGNGGEIFMAIPDLDLVIGFTGGNTMTRLSLSAAGFGPKYILPGVN
jgi:hypothetical protein